MPLIEQPHCDLEFDIGTASPVLDCDMETALSDSDASTDAGDLDATVSACTLLTCD